MNFGKKKRVLVFSHPFQLVSGHSWQELFDEFRDVGFRCLAHALSASPSEESAQKEAFHSE